MTENINDKDPIELTTKFMQDVKHNFNQDFFWIFIGSVAKGKYAHGKSDIDLIVFPHDNCVGVEDYLWMNKHGKTFGEVFKKGRMIGLFDVMIFVDDKMFQNWRDEVIKLQYEKKIKVYTTKKFK